MLGARDSLRRTKASIIDKATGKPRAVQTLLGHAKIENTVRYLGVEDALTLAENTEVSPRKAPRYRRGAEPAATDFGH